ncbi:MAG TPA: hypothetical protein VHO70_00585 [Chitinispirillaceae bacterium]|nr:hypothetical protein [Chitinispirillaceae bacterium]
MKTYLFSAIIISSTLLISAEETVDSNSTLPQASILQDSSSAVLNSVDSSDSALIRLEDTLNQTRTDIKLKKIAIRSADDELVEQIDDDIDELEDKIDALEDRIEELRQKKYADKTEDTIDAEFIFNKINEKRIAFTEKVSKSRAQGFGGGVMIQPMVLGLRMKPIHKFTQQSSSLRSFVFPDLDSKYNPFLVMGAFAYGGVGNGMRIGFGGWSGDALFDGERADGRNDSIMALKMNISYGGMLIEKALLHKNLNIIIGGIIGGGKYSLYRSMKSANAFNEFDFWDEFDNDADEAKAAFAGIEFHSGVTVTIFPWMHLGMDLNSLFSFSVSGFGGLGGSGFSTINPGARIRIVLGNLG